MSWDSVLMGAVTILFYAVLLAYSYRSKEDQGFPLVKPPSYCKGDGVRLTVHDDTLGGCVLVQGEVLDRGRRYDQRGQVCWVYQCIRHDTNDVNWYVEDDVRRGAA